MWSMYGVAPARRFVTGQRGIEREAGARLHNRAPCLVLAVGAGLPEAAVRDVDDVGPQLAEHLVGESHAGEDPGGEVLRHHVGGADERGQHLLALIGAQVERDAPLADVVVVEAAAHVDAPPLVDERAGRRG